MTVQTGHPDWQSLVTWRGPTIAATTVNVTSGSPYTVAQYVTNFESTYFGCALNTGVGVTITASWYTDSTLAVRMAQKQWILNAGQFINQAMPNLGNYLQVVVSTGQAGTQNVFVTVAANNIPADRIRAPRGGQFNGQTGLSVPNAGTPSILMTEVMDGDAILRAATSVTNTALGVFADVLDEGGNSICHLAELTGSTSSQWVPFSMTTQPIAFVVHNFTGSAVTVDWAVMMRSD